MAMDRPLWSPGEDRIDRANLSRFMRFVREETGKADLYSYAPLYHFSVEQPAAFWTLLWDFVGIRGSGERTPVLVEEDGVAVARWFPGVSLNFAQNLLRFDDERIAIRCHGADPDHDSISYAQLQRRVAALATAMRAAGVASGDRVAALLPNEPDALVAMLASASLGAIWFACPTRLAPEAAAALLQPLSPKLLFLADPAQWRELALADPGTVVVVVGAEGGSAPLAGHIGLHAFVAPFANAELEFAALAFDHPLYLTLATTSAGVEYLVHGAGGTLIQHLKELVLHADLKREDKIFFHADNDSMAWYWLASSLAVGSTLVLHAGAQLAAGEAGLWDLVDEFSVSVLGVHSRWLDAAAQTGLRPMDSHRLLSLKTILTAGAALSPDSYDFVYRDIKARVLLAPISTGGDTLACFALGAPVLPVWRGEIPCRGLGMKVGVLNASGAAVVGEAGDLVCSAPFPSTPLGFWDDPEHQRYAQASFFRQPGHWCSGERATLTARESIILAS